MCLLNLPEMNGVSTQGALSIWAMEQPLQVYRFHGNRGSNPWGGFELVVRGCGPGEAEGAQGPGLCRGGRRWAL